MYGLCGRQVQIGPGTQCVDFLRSTTNLGSQFRDELLRIDRFWKPVIKTVDGAKECRCRVTHGNQPRFTQFRVGPNRVDKITTR